MDTGVANNANYRDTHYFRDDFKITGDEFPSINDQDKINQTIKENPYRSNVNIEGGEIVLQPDLSALFKASGKKHHQGGMDVYLRPDSFVFSDYKDLAFSEEDHEMMELKEGGNFNKINNTPAQVLKRNVDVKHYNTLVNNTTDIKQDDLAKKSSIMMLEKYIKTLGNIAYLQEEKKRFPSGIPAVAMGTAPIYDPSKKEEIMESKQFAKYGGTIGNPYMQTGGSKLTKAQEDSVNRAMDFWFMKSKNPKDSWTNWLDSGNVSDEVTDEYIKRSNTDIDPRYPGHLGTDYTGMGPNGQYYKDGYPVANPNDVNNSRRHRAQVSPSPTRQDRYIGKYPPYPDQWTNYYDKTNKTQYTAPDWIKPDQFYAIPGLVDYMKTLDKHKGIDWDMSKADDSQWGWRHQIALNKFFPNGNKPVAPQIPTIDRKALLSQVGQNLNPRQSPDLLEAPINPNEVNGDPQGIKRADWEFTPWQKISQLHSWGQYANTKRYMPYRSRYNATYAEPSLLNPEQAVGDAKAMANQQLQALGSLNPIMRNAQAAASYGQALNQIPGIRAQYDNQNSQITNQFRQYNNQVRNNESMVNMQNDQNYYQQAVAGRANFDNMRTFTANNAMNNTLRDVETNQKLSYNMMTMDDPAYGFDFKSGNFYRNPKSIMDAQNTSQGDYIGSLLKDIDFKSLSNEEKIQYIRELQRGKALQYLPQAFNQQPPMKKGGSVKKNPYK